MKCNNNIGSYSCSCDEGFYLTSNGKDCSGKAFVDTCWVRINIVDL